MDFKTQNTTQQPQGASPVAARNGAAKGPNRGKLVTLLVSAVVVVLVVVAGLVAWQMKGGSAGGGVDKNGYQALFMTNGQVYFGHLSNLKSGYTELTDVYYLQVQQSVQPATDTKTTDSSQPQVSLTKLGNELHGPKDKMFVSKDQVLFWENLKDDSTVVKAIKDYQAKQ